MTAESTDNTSPQGVNAGLGSGKKQILLNAFDMSTIGHLSPGQWKVSTCLGNLKLILKR